MTSTPRPPAARRDVRLYALAALAALVLFGADALLLNRAEAVPASSTAATPVATPESAPAPVASEPVASEPVAAAPADAPAFDAAVPALALGAVCTFDTAIAPVADWASLVAPTDPSMGNARARVTVIEFFEPNCNHCASQHPVMKVAMQAYSAKARFVFKPVVFWPKSAVQAQALYAAAAEGKFFRMLDLQMARQKPATGFSEAEIRGMAREIGMNADGLMQRINAGTYRGNMMVQREAFGRTGGNSVPLILVNGRVVGPDRSAACLGQLIDQAARG